MNAIQPPTPTRKPLETRRMAPKTQRRQRRHSCGALAGETTARLVVNIVVSSAAIAGLVQLLPYHLSQQAKLGEVRAEVKRAESRVNHLRTDLGRSFAPGEARSVMQEQSYRVDPNQRSIVLGEQSTKDDN